MHPHLQGWLQEDNVLTCQPLHPNKHDLQILQIHQKQDGVLRVGQVAYQLPRTPGSLSSLTRVPRPLHAQDSTCRDRQHHSGVIHKQGRRHEVGPTLCFTMAECGRRQVIQARPDHPNRVVSPSGGLPSNMQQLAPASNRPICHEVQQQVAFVCVTGTGSHSHSSGCAQSAMVGSGSIHLPTISHIGQSGDVAGLPMQENHSDCSGVAHHVLVLGSSGHVQPNPTEPNPNLPNLLTQPFNQIPHRNLTNLNLDAQLLEPQHSRSRASLRRWQQELRLLKEDQPDQSMRQSGPLLQVVRH